MANEVSTSIGKSIDDLQTASKNASDVELTDSESLRDIQKNPFLDPKVANHYRQLYEDAKYECRHEFDPDFEWTPEEEKKIIKKLDYRICTWACVMFFALNVDRKNLPSAVSDNMLDQLGLSTNDYNYGTASNTEVLID
jgi:hypothetical protein